RKKFRLASDVDENADYDVAIVEGYAAIEEEVEMLKEIRENSSKVIALGSCSSYGSIHSIQNFIDIEKAKKEVYPDNPEAIETPQEAVSIDKHIQIDLKIPGCPPNADEAVELITDLISGKIEPELAEWPVCVDCKMRGNVCVLIHGIPCLGPVTRGGCGAPCPASYTCDGCRGPRKEPNLKSEIELLRKYIDDEEIIRFFKRYASSSEEFKKVIEGEISDGD
ncbi:MAG: oxidoreductase, partial [Hadesarchaea archaeon]|nr:oxidoreductase [Hadesarchaea archaeon]